MNKEFIPYEEALALKEIEFDEPCFAMFMRDELKLRCYCHNSEFTESHQLIFISAPTYSQAFRWFREKYDLDSHISRDYSLREIPKQYCYTINTEEGLEESKNFNTYEEAELECLKKLIEIVKDLAVVK
jgi:hypothetical protein